MRKERNRIAAAKKIPAYKVFDNDTLMEMAEEMPDSEMAMLQIHGVGPVKLRMYGASLLAIIEKFKKEFVATTNKKSDSA